MSDDCPGSRLGAVNGVKISHLPTGVPAVLSSSPFPFPGMAVGNPVKRFFFSQTIGLLTDPITQIHNHAVDQLAWGSMKNAAKCETQCELQDT